MEFSNAQISYIKAKAISKIVHEFEIAMKHGNIDEFLDKHDIVFEEDPLPVDIRTMRILVLGDLAGSKKDYQMRAKKMGLKIDHLEFMDYEQAKRFDAYNLRDSGEYSDIIYGPTPHSMIGIEGASSLLIKIKQEPARYPRLNKAISNGKLKISITGFEKCLRRTRYWEAMY
jgi:hypothetical protein